MTPCIGRDEESNRKRNPSRNRDYLSLKGYLFSRTNNSAIYDTTNSAFRALPKYTRRGWPDICLIKGGVFYGTEVKAEKGSYLPTNRRWERKLNETAAITLSPAR
jgi:hypothetical protein